MEKYIGTKMIYADTMTRGEYNIYKGRKIPPDENPNDEGYVVKYDDNYVSWSPKDVFEKAYRRIDAMTFGLAIEAIKKGLHVQRKGWSGKNMWLVLVKSSNYTVDYVRSGSCEICPWIGVKTADDKFIPWLASQSDMLAEDWQVIKE
jgi:hypothetical protein